MPTVFTHLLVPIFIVALLRDFILKKHDRKKFPLHYVLIAGIGGVLPDIDVLVFVFLGFFGYTLEQVHRKISHSITAVGFFVFLSIVTIPLKNYFVGKHKLKWHWIFLALAFGILTHGLLDGFIQGDIHPLAPFSNQEFGLNLVNYLPAHIQGFAIPLFEGILLMLWIIYLEWKHKISDFI